MKKLIPGLFILVIGIQWAFSQNSDEGQEIIQLSKDK